MKYLISAILLTFFLSTKTTGETANFKSFDGIKISYTDEGTGTPVILIHGFISGGSSWYNSPLKKSLIDKGYRVIIPDMRGNGNSDKPHNDEAYSDNAEIKDLMALVDHLNLQKYISIGYSRGSILLAKLLTLDSRIEKAVIGGMGLDFTNPEWERRKIFAEAFNENAQTTELTAGAVNYAKKLGADFRALHLMQKHQPVTSVEELVKINTKILVIAGDADNDNGNPEDLQKYLPNSALKIIPGTHNNTANSKEFAISILDFLSK
jgi:pimeloyl-ACP methyl ester carboxylesterase